MSFAYWDYFQVSKMEKKFDNFDQSAIHNTLTELIDNSNINNEKQQ